MLSISIPWWELALRAIVIYVLLLIMVRLSGRRTVGQFTPFDLLVVMLLSESVSNALSGGEDSLAGGLLSALTLILMNWIIGYASARSRRIDRLIEGTAALIGRDGALDERALRRYNLSRAEVERAMRAADCELQQLDRAYLEADGSISVLQQRKSSKADAA